MTMVQVSLEFLLTHMKNHASHVFVNHLAVYGKTVLAFSQRQYYRQEVFYLHDANLL